jgi:uncharacterized protein (TIGR02217 family)
VALAFLESRLSDRIALGFQSIPGYNTRIVPLDNGQEDRNANWTKAKRRYTALYANFTPAQFAELLAFFHVVRGSARAFRFKDWMDFEALFSYLGQTPGANLTPMQLRKAYEVDGEAVYRTIKKPRAGTITVYQDNGSGVFVAKPGTTDTTTGLFTPTTNWTAGRAVKASFEFDTPVRFVGDELPSSWDNKRAINTQAQLIEDFLR